ncbi:hypothetical protein PsYK624_099910 [Phanerochaete sordida]|uniref:DUF6534 domain-containing protein n=1 Tax=Phanerochaete sordida TaxID=48140 RepID=A0A9P3GFD7_9APHY|nr:hypothetical protein PsYK624_099910 [Phanerochaete sordida]
MQAYHYFPSRDALHLQVAAVVMLILNISSSALTAQSVYFYLVPHFGSLLPFSSITSELNTECIIHTTITFMSQGYFAVQLYSVAKIKTRMFVVPIFVGFCAILAFGFGIGKPIAKMSRTTAPSLTPPTPAACTTMMFVHSQNVLAERSSMFSLFFGLAKGCAAATDFVATLAMCLMLASSRTGMHGTNSLIDRLMRYVMRRGVLVALVQCLLLVSFYAAPGHLYWLVFHVNVTKLYANTFFSMLNAREDLHRQRRASNALAFAPSESGESARKSRALLSGARSDTECARRASTDVEMARADPAGGAKASMPTITRTVVIREL